MDETMHAGQGKHYLDIKVQNAGIKPVAAFEYTTVYADKMGDLSNSATYISQNTHAIKPGATFGSSAMDRDHSAQNGMGQVTVYVSRVRFDDGTYWRDDGSRSCSRVANLR